MESGKSKGMNEELKPVPCGCGGEAEVHEQEYGEYEVYCPRCFITTDDYATEAEAIQAWNRAMGNRDNLSRIERTEKVETVEKPNVFKCGKYGQYMHSTSWGSPVEFCSRCGAKLDWSGNE